MGHNVSLADLYLLMTLNSVWLFMLKVVNMCPRLQCLTRIYRCINLSMLKRCITIICTKIDNHKILHINSSHVVILYWSYDYWALVSWLPLVLAFLNNMGQFCPVFLLPYKETCLQNAPSYPKIYIKTSVMKLWKMQQ